MNAAIENATELSDTKRKLLDASVTLMRTKGYNATTVDDVCASAGVTKGAFFYYFKSKEDLAKATLARFYDRRLQDFQNAPFRKMADPLDRIFGRLDFGVEYIGGPDQLTKGCLIGMFAQELSFTNPELRVASFEALRKSVADVEKDLAAAKAVHTPQVDFNPRQVAQLYVSMYQGALMMAKASESNRILVENLELFRQYLTFLFGKVPQATAIAHN